MQIYAELIQLSIVIATIYGVHAAAAATATVAFDYCYYFIQRIN